MKNKEEEEGFKEFLKGFLKELVKKDIEEKKVGTGKTELKEEEEKVKGKKEG